MVARAVTPKAIKRTAVSGTTKLARLALRRIMGATVVMEDARRAGLLDGDKTEHVSFRAPKALIEAAMRASGATKPTELGLLALATLAQPDPTAIFMKKTRGKLGSAHELDY